MEDFARNRQAAQLLGGREQRRVQDRRSRSLLRRGKGERQPVSYGRRQRRELDRRLILTISDGDAIARRA